MVRIQSDDAGTHCLVSGVMKLATSSSFADLALPPPSCASVMRPMRPTAVTSAPAGSTRSSCNTPTCVALPSMSCYRCGADDRKTSPRKNNPASSALHAALACSPHSSEDARPTHPHSATRSSARAVSAA